MRKGNSFIAMRQRMARLKKAKEAVSRKINLSDLERDFLGFSKISEKPSLHIRKSPLHNLSSEESEKYLDVLLAIEEETGVSHIIPNLIDYAGSSVDPELTNLLCFVSPSSQLAVGRASEYRTFLDPLVELIYKRSMATLNEFSIHEAIYGEVTISSSGFNLSELPLFPGKFHQGPYQLRTTLDTASSSISDFIHLQQEFERMSKDPKSSVLDKCGIDSLTEKAISLQGRITALGRFSPVGDNVFIAETNSAIVNYGGSEAVFFYLPDQVAKRKDLPKNVMVYFGVDPFEKNGKTPPRSLLVYDGNRHQETVAALISLGLFDVSAPVLKSRISSIQEIIGRNSSNGADQISNYQTLSSFYKKLIAADRYFDQTLNPNSQRDYALNGDHVLLEFMVKPNSNDPLVHQLIPRLSWNPILRNYHSTSSFIKKFSSVDSDAKASMLQEIQSSIIFANQQNYDVNNWLYENHKDFCESVGVNFTSDY